MIRRSVHRPHIAAAILLMGAVAMGKVGSEPLPTTASQSPNFAWAWPLNIDSEVDVAAFELTPEIYAQLVREDLRDMIVVNAAGDAVPFGPLPTSAQASPAPAAMTAVPVFRIPKSSAADADDLSLHLERDDNGRLRALRADIANRAAPAQAQFLLLDLSDVDAAYRGLQFDLAPDSVGQLNARIEIAVGSDLAHWRVHAPAQALLSLQQGEFQLQRLDVSFAATREPYVRVRRLDSEAHLPVVAVLAHRAPAQSAPLVRLGISRSGSPSKDLRGSFEFLLDGPFAVDQVGVQLADRNGLANIVIESRPGSTEQWRERARGTAFRLAGEAGEDIGAIPFNLPTTRDRHWRLRSEPALHTSPTLSFGYRSEAYVMLAQGSGPFLLLAGSASSARADYPLDAVFASKRQRHGADWLPMRVSPGRGYSYAGEAARNAVKPPLPLGKWLLWASLVVASMLIIGLAIQLLREGKRR